MTKAEREELKRYEAMCDAYWEEKEASIKGRGTNWGAQKSKKYVAALEVAFLRFSDQTIQGYLKTGGAFGLYHLLSQHSWLWSPSNVRWIKPSEQLNHLPIGSAA